MDLYEQALELAQGPDSKDEEVLELLRAAHAKGDSRAAYALATWFLHGHGQLVRRNLRKAVQLLREAASANLASACYDLAVCYEKGAGVKRSYSRAFEFYQRAALAGHDQSFYEVGRCYCWGIGTARNRRLAFLWLDKAAELGYQD